MEAEQALMAGAAVKEAAGDEAAGEEAALEVGSQVGILFPCLPFTLHYIHIHIQMLSGASTTCLHVSMSTLKLSLLHSYPRLLNSHTTPTPATATGPWPWPWP